MKANAFPDTSPRIGTGRATTLIVNGIASATGVGDEVLARALAQLRRSGIKARGHVTFTERELHQVLEERPTGRVILFGGDGTLHGAVNAPAPLPELALVPAGRANNIARALGLPLDPEKALALAATAPALPVDVLRVETGDLTHYAIEAVSAGLQADARARYSGANSGDLRAGVGAFAAALRDYRPYRTGLALDRGSEVAVEAAQIFISNMPFFGFGFRVNPAGDPTDGKLESIVMRARTRRRAVRLLAAAYRGQHLEQRGVSLRRGREATLTEALPLVSDGAPLGVDRAAISVESGRLRMVSAWRR